MNDVFQFLTMRFFNDVSKNCKISCKRCILNDASNTPTLTPKLLELCAVRRKLGTNLFCTDQSSAGMHILHGHPECTMGGSQKNSDWLLNIRHGWWQNDFFFCKTCKSNMAQYHGTGWTKTSRWNGLEIWIQTTCEKVK